MLAAADLDLPVGSQTDNPAWVSTDRCCAVRAGAVATDERPRARLTTWAQPTLASARHTARTSGVLAAAADQTSGHVRVWYKVTAFGAPWRGLPAARSLAVVEASQRPMEAFRGAGRSP